MNAKSKLQDIKVLEQYLEEGKTDRQIAEIYGVPINTVKGWVTKHKLGGKRRRGGSTKQTKTITKKETKKLELAAGANADRHLCKSCEYRARNAKTGCDYIEITGHSRGCDPEDCDKYKRGRRRKLNLHATTNGYGKHK